MKYLKVDQALYDFSLCVQNFKNKLNIPNAKVLSLGGSYGGLLSIWMRIRFPNIIDVGYGASAPIFENYGLADPNFFFDKITSVVDSYNSNCPNLIRSAFSQIDIT